MNTKCSNCGLINWADTIFCKRCLINFKTGEIPESVRAIQPSAPKRPPQKIPFLMSLLFKFLYLIGILITFAITGLSFVVCGKITNSERFTIIVAVISFIPPLAFTSGIIEYWKDTIRYPEKKSTQST